MTIPEFMEFYFVTACCLYEEMFLDLNLENMKPEDAEAWKAILHVFRMGKQLKVRNCDLYRDPQEMQQAFQRFCQGVDGCRNCPAFIAWHNGSCIFAWSQLPATHEKCNDTSGGENDAATPL